MKNTKMTMRVWFHVVALLCAICMVLVWPGAALANGSIFTKVEC